MREERWSVAEDAVEDQAGSWTAGRTKREGWTKASKRGGEGT